MKEEVMFELGLKARVSVSLVIGGKNILGRLNKFVETIKAFKTICYGVQYV